MEKLYQQPDKLFLKETGKTVAMNKLLERWKPTHHDVLRKLVALERILAAPPIYDPGCQF